MHTWKSQCLEYMTFSAGSLGRKTCLLSCKTGSGKSLIPRGADTFKRKVPLVIMPLLSISSNQHSKIMINYERHNTNSIYVDAFVKNSSHSVWGNLLTCLSCINPSSYPSITMFCLLDLVIRD